MRNARAIFGILALTLASTSCLRQKTQARVFIPPPARPAAKVPQEPPPLPEPPQIAADQAAPPSLPEMTPGAFGEIPEAPKRVPRRPAQHIDTPKPVIAPAAPEPAAPPKLAQMFTPEEFRQNTRTLEESLERVARALAIVEGKSLTPDQREIVERIRTFRKQAEQARDEDLLTAVSLAKRADLLAKDLLERLP
ncbi:MAG TPA: hypothetical protein VMT15_01970 [Bryobacteraceae bacterium]|nr:hypothetical protein [Bryobacteraceae bacterium]